MQFLFDNLIATVVVLVLTLVLLSTTLRRQSESAGIANHQAVAGRTASIAATLRRDIESLAAVQAVTDTSFDFSVTVDPTTTPITTGTVRYRRRQQPDGSYLVMRLDGSGASRAIGPPMRDWRVTLLTRADVPTAALAEARRVRVRMVTAPAFAQPGDSLDVVWERVFSPSLLGTPSL